MTTAGVQSIPARVTALSIGRLTTGYLLGGLVVGIGLGAAIGAPAHSVRNVLAGVVAMICMTCAGALWARSLARAVGRTNDSDVSAATRAGAWSFGPITIAVGLILTLLEQTLVGGANGPVSAIHVVYGLLFVPAASIIAGLTTWIVVRTLLVEARGRHRVALATAMATGGIYLAIYLAMDAAGWRVGGPDAAKRATMLVVTGVAGAGACMAGALTLGRVLIRARLTA
jgi:hypothetical protein